MMPRIALPVANPLIVITVPADWDDAGEHHVGASLSSGSDSDLHVSIHRGPFPERPESGRRGSLDLSNSPMNPANHSMKEKVQ